MNDYAEKNINNSLLNLAGLLDSVKGSIIGDSFISDSFYFDSVVTDSRNVKKNSLFVPLIGEYQDGHNYIIPSIKSGASVIFVCKHVFKKNAELYEKLANENKNVAFILVNNTLMALQKSAMKYVSKFPNLIKIAVTGSSGKTTTKEIAVSILKQKYNVICNKGNLNSETGLPLSVFEIRKEHQVGIFEMGMNRKNEIKEICNVLKPNYGIITNIGTAHIGLLGSQKKIAIEKKNVFNFINKNGAAIIPSDDKFAKFLSRGIKGKKIFYGSNIEENGIKFINDEGINGTNFKINDVEIHLSLPGHYNYLNTLAAVELAQCLSISPDQIKKGIESLQSLDKRSHIIKGKYIILEDCYNANPDSMEKAIEFSNELNINTAKVYVLGDMLELGDESCRAHKKIGEIACSQNVNMIIFVGKESYIGYQEAKKLCENKNTEVLYYENFKDEDICNISEEIINTFDKGAFILIKASHGLNLGRLVPILQKEGKCNEK